MPTKSAKRKTATKGAAKATTKRVKKAGAKKAATTRAAAKQFDWPTTSDPVGHDANVVIGFHGLMCFCHSHRDGSKECEVGIHNTQLGGHDLTITVYKVASTFDPPYNMNMGTPTLYKGPFKFGDTGNTKAHKVRFDVDKPVTPGVSYLQIGGQKDNPNNFRFILDLEGDDFYKDIELSKQGDNLGPRLRIQSGLFYTLCKSTTEFWRLSSTGGLKDIGSIARIIGANIYLQSGGSVSLKMKGAEKVKLRESEGKFFILVDNGCHCSFNDFLFYYQTFNVPAANASGFTLLAKPGTGGPSPCDDFLEQLDNVLRAQKKLMSTDDAPCGVAGFGSSGGIP